ncbi:Ethylene-responsive transcription factor-like protein [Sesamum angolense]|uniref:Ethylene-responsive transcription factor-like protein n=1 Tax=Sesamum angolense TaxID=2727404 RepID=A0AAE2C4Y2_9LAMI|nr:Ethylene-responsive transcription factor-like protein [Sesamum angolense]
MTFLLVKNVEILVVRVYVGSGERYILLRASASITLNFVNILSLACISVAASIDGESDSHGEHSKTQALRNVLRSSFLAPLSCAFEHGHTPENYAENTKPVSVHPLPLNDNYKPNELVCFRYETVYPLNAELRKPPQKLALAHQTCLLPARQKKHLIQQFPEIKRRKRHRRKQMENQEQCVMRGVYFKNLKWQAAIKVDKKQIHLGTVGSQEEAARLYDRAAFMCGREPNFELSEDEKQELRKFKWDEFLAMTRSAITNKKSQRKSGTVPRRKIEENEWEGEQGRNGFSASEDEALAP